MVKTLKNNRGMALVVALLTSFILLALVASLFWVIASTSRQADYAKNSAIALNLAEAGTADAIFRLNYGNDLDLYPFFGTSNPFGIPASDLISISPLPVELPPEPASVSYASWGIKGNLNNGYYVVGLLDDAAGSDTIIAVGVYKGVRRTLTVPLRGNSGILSVRQALTQGISEAFNKHVIYANDITIPVSVTVNGNIVYTNLASVPLCSGNWTRTIITNSQFVVPVPDFTFPVELNPADYTDTYSGGRYYISGVDQGAPTPPVEYLAGTYIFNGATISTPTWVQDGTVEIKGSTQIDTAFGAGGAIRVTGINPLIFSGSNSFLRATTGGIILDAVTAACSLYVVDSDITFTNSSQITPNSNSVAAIIISSSADNCTIRMGSTNNSINGSGKAAIIAKLPNTKTLTIDNNSALAITGLIYVYADLLANTANIQLTRGTINGILVADGMVILTDGTLNYDSSIFTGVSSVSDIFSGFSGGRRVYVPVWQGWGLR